MKIDVIPLAPLGANCILLSNDDKQLTIIDPGGEPDKIARYASEKGLKPVQIFCTHGHFDHVGGITDLKVRYNIPVYIHSLDSKLLSTASASAEYFGLPPVQNPTATDFYKDGDYYEFGAVQIRVIHTPGHTPGGVCLHIPQMLTVITGDTLFFQSVGRTDLQGGNHTALMNSIKTKLYTLDENTRVIPGHGANTTIKYEKEHNPYVAG